MKIEPQYTVTGCLLNAYRRDREKGYDENSAGWRSTREVADFTSQSITTVRRQLNKLNQSEIISWDKAVDRGGDLWVINELLKAGDRVKVIRSIGLGGRSEIVEAEVTGIYKESVLPIQVKFDDGQTTGYLHQEIREIVR